MYILKMRKLSKAQTIVTYPEKFIFEKVCPTHSPQAQVWILGIESIGQERAGGLETAFLAMAEEQAEG
jgi:hypothetical protein